MASNDLQSVYLDDLMVSEQLFSLNVYDAYDLQEMEEGDIAARLVRQNMVWKDDSGTNGMLDQLV
jgi:hypothetical protein